MNKDDIKNGVSLFSQSENLIDGDPIEEIFALNLGDFLSEHLISEDLAKKIGAKSHDKKAGLINQLKELISIYSLDKTLCVLNFDPQQETAVFNSIAYTITQMIEEKICNIYIIRENAFSHAGSSDGKSARFIFKPEDFKTKETQKLRNRTVVPMFSGTSLIGAIDIINSKEIIPEYLTLVESIANLLATSIALQKEIDIVNKLIENSESDITDLQHSRAELTALIGDLCDYQQFFVERLASAVDTKGQYKVSHSKNTAELARKICRELGLNEKTTDLIYYAGLLQNIGKITLPESIFATHGKLSDEDFKKIQEHANRGVNLLMNINFLSEVVPYITYQKERFDGSGEPEGLKGQSIPFGSRIIAAADAYSAMTSDRPYRKAMDKEKALEIIKSESGSKWDPVVAEALAKVAGEN